MVGRAPDLKYFIAASSNSRPYSSAGWRHDTSAWVCTSKATRSSNFIFVIVTVRLLCRCERETDNRQCEMWNDPENLSFSVSGCLLSVSHSLYDDHVVAG